MPDARQVQAVNRTAKRLIMASTPQRTFWFYPAN
jgi:hypothetical protein